MFAFALLYGVVNGLLTIAKATLPVEMFGLANVGAVLGNFSAPSLVTRALAPLGFSLATEGVGTHSALAGTTAVALASLAAFAFATRTDSKQPAI